MIVRMILREREESKHLREKYDQNMSDLRDKSDHLVAQLSTAKNKKSTIEKEVWENSVHLFMIDFVDLCVVTNC